MRPGLGQLLCALLIGSALGACGGNDAGTVTDQPAPSPSSRTTASPTKGGTGRPVDFDLVTTVTATDAGGTVTGSAVPLVDDTAVEEFATQFKTDTMTTKLLDAVHAAKVPDDELLYAAVVAVGCDSPDQVAVTSGGSGLVITAQQVPSPQQECFAAMTTVALVLVPDSAVG
jgi:hypothetical protein